MDNLNQIEIQNIRHICGHSTGFCDKIAYYKTVVQDENANNVLDNICTMLNKLKTDLTNLL